MQNSGAPNKKVIADKKKERERKKYQQMVDELSDEQKMEFLQLFARFVADPKMLDPSEPFKPEDLEKYKAMSIREKDVERMCKNHGYGHKASDPIKKEEVKNMLSEVDEDGQGQIEFDEFLLLMVKHLNENELADEVIKAFQVLSQPTFEGNEAKDSGKVPASQLKYYMTNFGEKLTDEEVDELFNEADITYDKEIDIEDFVRTTLLK